MLLFSRRVLKVQLCLSFFIRYCPSMFFSFFLAIACILLTIYVYFSYVFTVEIVNDFTNMPLLLDNTPVYVIPTYRLSTICG